MPYKSSAEQMKVHTMFVIGKRDMEASAVSVRVHGKGNLGAKPRGEAIAEILQSIKERGGAERWKDCDRGIRHRRPCQQHRAGALQCGWKLGQKLQRHWQSHYRR